MLVYFFFNVVVRKLEIAVADIGGLHYIYLLDNTDKHSLLLPFPCLYRWILSMTQSPEL